MKTRLLLIALCVSGMMFAQTGEKVGYSDNAGIKTEFKTNKFWDNWYLSLGGGIAAYDGDITGDFMDQVTEPNIIGKLTVGKWINPMFGMRLQGLYTKIEDTRAGVSSFKYAGAHVDAMLDLMNTFGRYNEKRIFSIIPFVGLGYAQAFDYQRIPNGTNSLLTVNYGLIGKFRLSRAFDLSVELAAATLPESTDSYSPTSRNNDYMYDATLNLAYKFKTRDFTVVEPMDYDLINSLNDEINSLRSKLNKKLPPRIIKKPVIKNVTNYIPNVVYFKINSAKIRETQQLSIRNVADFLKTQKNVKIKVIGYADRKTGNPTYNAKLSEKRAKAVAKVLADKYGIDASRIAIQWKGDSVQPYDVNEWNRVVVFEAK